MFELIQKGGWLIWPILACSVISVAIICERFWALRIERIIPSQLVPQVWRLYKDHELDHARIRSLRMSSPLGAVLGAGLLNYKHGREIMKESIEEAGRQVVHDLERFLNTLGTIASISPLLGLLGTVVGMIKVFAVITVGGMADPTKLAGGISEALITTATGLSVAIPALIFYRFFQGKVEMLVLMMEEESLKLIEIMHGDRDET